MPVQYQRLLADVSRRTGLGSGPVRAAAEATVTAFARALREPDRSRFLEAMPPEMYDDFAIGGEAREWDEAGFVREVSLLSGRPGEQARLRAQAVLAAIAEADPDLMAGLAVPEALRGLLAAPDVGGGVVSGPTEHEPPLTADEVRDALRGLPDWSGGTDELRRTLVLPPGNLDAVLDRIGAVKQELGRGPTVHRRGGDTADLVVSTASVGAVTALDVELASRIDTLVAEAAAGIG